MESRDYKIPRVRDLVTASLRFSRKFLNRQMLLTWMICGNHEDYQYLESLSIFFPQNQNDASVYMR